MTLTVAPAHFERMLAVPEGSFLDREWWGELMAVRDRWA